MSSQSAGLISLIITNSDLIILSHNLSPSTAVIIIILHVFHVIFKKSIFNWKINGLQYCIGFCYIST